MKEKLSGMRPVLASCGIVVAAVLGFTAVAGEGGEASVDHFQFFEYEEQVGAWEFSGTMIARPKSVEAWQSDGLSRVEATARRASAAEYLEDHFQIKRYVPQLDHYVFHVPEGSTENDVARALLQTGNYKFVEPNWTVYPVGCPDDPQLGQQWHHDDDHLQSCAGWDVYTGDPSVSVGVCDTGIRVTHEDLQDHRLEGYNAVDRVWENDGGRISDIFGHGTETTGCAAANGDNGIGVSGVGWDLSHRMLRVTNSSGGGSDIETLNHAAITAVENGDRVASLSYSGVENQATLDAATYIKSIGGLMIWAAGNWGQNMNMNDRDADDVLVIGATDINDNKASWSNHGRFVDFVAPGVTVYTPSHTGDSAYRGADGTSFACPLVSGLAALIWSVNPDLTPDDVELIIKDTCDDLGNPGIDDTYGYGRINVFEAMAIATDDPPMRLNIDELIAGRRETLSAYNCSPNEPVHFVYSTAGAGETYVPQLDVTLDLQSPRLAKSTRADADGNASANVFIPLQFVGRHVWIQAAQFQRVSDVWDDDII